MGMKNLYRIFMGRGPRVIFIYRISNFFATKNVKILADFFRSLNLTLNSVDIHPNSKISRSIIMPHPIGIVIGEGVVVEDNVYIYQNVTLGSKINSQTKKLEYPLIKENTKIYSGAVVIGDITINNGTIVGANTFVSKTFPENAILTGVHAVNLADKVVKS